MGITIFFQGNRPNQTATLFVNIWNLYYVSYVISEDLIFVGGPQATFSDLQAINQQRFSLLLEPAKLSTHKEVARSLAKEICIY